MTNAIRAHTATITVTRASDKLAAKNPNNEVHLYMFKYDDHIRLETISSELYGGINLLLGF